MALVAATAPIHAPNELPTPISGNRRSPCFWVYRSFANAQSCAITRTLKTPTHRKNAMPSRTPVFPRKMKTTRFEAQNRVTPVTRRTRFTRDATDAKERHQDEQER